MAFCLRGRDVISALDSAKCMWCSNLARKFVTSKMPKRSCSRVNISLGKNGGDLIVESGRLARLADGCAVARFGDGAAMVTAVSAKTPQHSATFLPLTVDYREKAAAAGRIPTNFLRRELGPTDREILTSRMIDRAIRPLFPKAYYCETQLSCNLLAVDGRHEPDVASMNAASAALCLSDVPWNGPLGAVRLGLIADKLVVNPTRLQMHKSLMNLVLAGTVVNNEKRTVMIDFSGHNVEYAVVQSAIKTGMDVVEEICAGIHQLQQQIGKPKRPTITDERISVELLNSCRSLAETDIKGILGTHSHDKFSRDEALRALAADVTRTLATCYAETPQAVLQSGFFQIVREVYREMLLRGEKRMDGRGAEDLRPIECEVDVFKPLHGSALFQRGQTQVLCTVAFDSPDAAFRSVSAGAVTEKRFMLHYEFPPYATNEVFASRAPGRRELGHGALAEKALHPLVPKNFPFTVRLTSEVLESNGSSSMASVSAGSLALMDAGVQIEAGAAGVAIGLVSSEDGKYQLLADINGFEDYNGDMDFKIAGTAKGFTAMQLDLKVAGLPKGVLIGALDLAVKSKRQILSIMDQTLPAARSSLKEGGPDIETLRVPPEKRSRVVGLGGVNLKRVQAETGVQITAIDDRTFSVFAPNTDAMNEAKEAFESLLNAAEDLELEFGAIYSGRIEEVKESGVMVRLQPQAPPVFVHNSQLDTRKVSHPSVLGLEVGHQLRMKFFGRDPADGRPRFSRKALLATAPPGVTSFPERQQKSPWTTNP